MRSPDWLLLQCQLALTGIAVTGFFEGLHVDGTLRLWVEYFSDSWLQLQLQAQPFKFRGSIPGGADSTEYFARRGLK